MPIGTYLKAIEKIKKTTYVPYFTLCGKNFAENGYSTKMYFTLYS